MREKNMTAIAVAKSAGVGLGYLYSLLWTGKLKGRKVDGRWMIPAAEARALLATRKGRGRKPTAKYPRALNKTRISSAESVPLAAAGIAEQGEIAMRV